MKEALTPLKFISITCEHSAEKKVLKVLHKQGIRSARVTETRIVDFSGESEVDLVGTQLKIECVASEDTIHHIVENVKFLLQANFDLGFFVTDATVLRPHVFCSEKKPS